MDQAALAREVEDGKREITASQPKDAPPGTFSRAGSQDALNNYVQTQAREAASGMQPMQAEAAQAGRSLHTSSPEQAPTWREHTADTSAEQTQKAGQTLENAGARYDGPAQSAETKADLQSALDKSAQSSQNAPSEGSRLSAARQEAASDPAPSPSPSRSMEQ